jgi:hypothetical protein
MALLFRVSVSARRLGPRTVVWNKQTVLRTVARLHGFECFRLGLEPFLNARDRLPELHQRVARLRSPSGGELRRRNEAAWVGEEYGQHRRVILAEVAMIGAIRWVVGLATCAQCLTRGRRATDVAKLPWKRCRVHGAVAGAVENKGRVACPEGKTLISSVSSLTMSTLALIQMSEMNARTGWGCTVTRHVMRSPGPPFGERPPAGRAR